MPGNLTSSFSAKNLFFGTGGMGEMDKWMCQEPLEKSPYLASDKQ
jgi:hypothetical protein